MTSLSRRKRRTTPWRTPPRRTGISLAVLVAAAAGAAAQSPTVPPVPAPPPAQPAAPGRVVLFQKPPGDAQPPDKTEKFTKPPAGPAERPTPPASQPPGGRTRRDVAQLENDEQLLRRLIEELKAEEIERRKDDPTFKGLPAPPYYEVPATEPLVPPGTPYVAKPVREGYPPMRSVIEPDYVVHRRLYFEEKNSERYGWDLGITQPIVSSLYFYKDVLFWPAKLASNPFERYDASAGKCLPGSPVPYYLYPPEVDLFGATVGAATIVGAAAILP